MDLLKCRVCDADGKVENADIGKSISASNNYTFYAIPDGESGNSNVKHPLVTMPVGGNMGLFRFPRVGEWVLIGNLGVTKCETVKVGSSKDVSRVTLPSGDWVLLSYFIDTPAANAPFYPTDSQATADDATTGYIADQLNPANMDDFIHDNGMAMRYKVEENKNKTQQKVATNAQWSEIGFYNKKAKWPSARTPVDESRYYRQDMINIQSAGDIESRAENYHLIKAKRFELLANTDELSPELRADNANSDDWASGKAPLGDSPLDDPMLKEGDVHIRAGKRVIIKANAEIRLQVGRTTLIINDGGFSVVTQKLNSGVGLGYDTSFAMNSRTGIKMSGQKVDIGSIAGFSVSDAWGATVNGSLGLLNMGGKYIKQASLDTYSSIFLSIVNSVEAGKNIGLGARTLLDKKSSQDQFNKEAWGVDLAETIVKDLEFVLPFSKGRGKEWAKNFIERINSPDANAPVAQADAPENTMFNYLEMFECLILCLNTVLGITGTVYASIEAELAKEQNSDVERSKTTGASVWWSPEKKSAWKDGINLASMAIDNGIITAAMDIAVGKAAIGATIPGAAAEIRLRPSGDIVIDAAKYLNNYGSVRADNATPPWSIGKGAANVWKAVSGAGKIATDMAKFASSYPTIYDRVKPWLEGL